MSRYIILFQFSISIIYIGCFCCSNSDGHHKSQHEPRFVFLETKKSSNLGISLVGGNAVGIFIHSVAQDSPADVAGLRMGDQILEYNGGDLRHATAEEAAYELAKPADKVTMLVQFSVDSTSNLIFPSFGVSNTICYFQGITRSKTNHVTASTFGQCLTVIMKRLSPTCASGRTTFCTSTILCSMDHQGIGEPG